jgi:hypothetical protein
MKRRFFFRKKPGRRGSWVRCHAFSVQYSGDSGQFLQGGGDMKVDVPNGAVQVGRGEDNRIAVMINGADMEGAIMLDPQKFTEDEGKELGAMLWRVIERWQAARQPLK